MPVLHGNQRMMKLRPATQADIPAIHALIERAYRGDSARVGWSHEADLLGGQRTDRAALEALIADPLQTLLVHEAADEIIACAALAQKRGGFAYLGMVTVEPARQGCGLGRSLLAAVESYAAEVLGIERLEMTVIMQRHELIAWYERLGYRPTGERRPFPDDPRFGIPKRPDIEFIVLEKRL